MFQTPLGSQTKRDRPLSDQGARKDTDLFYTNSSGEVVPLGKPPVPNNEAGARRSSLTAASRGYNSSSINSSSSNTGQDLRVSVAELRKHSKAIHALGKSPGYQGSQAKAKMAWSQESDI